MTHVFMSSTVFQGESPEQAYAWLKGMADYDDDWDEHSGGVIQDSEFVEPILSDAKAAIANAIGALKSRVDSYGPALAVPLIKVEPVRYERARRETITLDFTARELNQDDHFMILTSLGKKKVAEAFGVGVDEIEQVRHAASPNVKPRMTLRYKAETVPGKAETRYFVVRQGSNTMPAWENGFATQALARASVNGAQTLDAYVSRVSDLEIVGITRREDGRALVNSSVHIASATLTLDVTLRRKVSERKVTNERGWLIVGSYHC